VSGTAPTPGSPTPAAENRARRELQPQSVKEDRRHSAEYGELYLHSRAAEVGFSKDEFGRLSGEIAGKYLPSSAGDVDRLEFCRALRLEELALARACAAGNEHAWELFLTRYREKLYDAARAITREDSSARELADSLYADLYGTESRDGVRRSKLLYYTGRGSLEGWLRATLAQEYVNWYRRQQRLVSLEEKTEAGAQFAAADPSPAQAPDPRLAEAADVALAALAAEDRFILASYYLDGRKLAEIARSLGVHESTISRKLEKVARAVRQRIVEELMRRGMSRRQAEEALETDVRDVAVDIRERLTQKSGASAFLEKGIDGE
jgi:RNA polymerase sigma-70 factor (ECF subfamily)